MSTRAVPIGTVAFAALAVLFLMPLPIHAAHWAEARGPLPAQAGGTVLSRIAMGSSHTTATSGLMGRLQFASTQGTPHEDTPSSQGTTGSNTNGGVTTGVGGNGGDAAQGGVIRAGNVVSHAHALTILNTVVIRLGR